LASAYAAQGKTLSAVRAEAEVNVVQLDYAAALSRLKAAQDMARKGVGARDHIEASIIDTRTRQVELLVREQAVER
jgi:predicted Zn-dependent protease